MCPRAPYCVALFCLFVNGTNHVITGNSSLLLFADDSNNKIFKTVASLEDGDVLQNFMDDLFDWCKLNEMNVNTSRCTVKTFLRSHSHITHEYYNKTVGLTRSYK